MQAPRHIRTRRSTRLMVWFGLLALLVQALVPAGYMLTSGAERRLTVELCAGMAGQALTFDLNSGEWRPLSSEDTAPKAPTADDPCAFAGLTASLLTPPAGSFVAAPILASLSAPRSTPRAQRPASSITGPPLPARGPPMFA